MTNKPEAYLGYREQDYQHSFAKYFDATAECRPLANTEQALNHGRTPSGSLPSIEQIPALLQPGYTGLEDGFTLEPDGSARVAALTSMPGVQPLMWGWWFAWHGDQDAKYKLWHPRAHVSAVWED